MGAQKLLLPVGGRPMVRRVVDAAVGSRAARTIVVIGHEADAVREALDGAPVVVTANGDYAAGMSTSLQAGLRATPGMCGAAIFLLGDQPYVTSALLDEMIDRFVSTGAAVVRPVVGGRHANPVLMSAALFPEILEQRGDVGGREIVERHAGEVSLISVDDPRLCVDVDSPLDYKTVREST
jgi:molybdenum cofactor cytidylyltransferase